MEEKKLFLSAPVLAYPPDRQGGIPQPYSILTDPQSISSVAIRSHYLQSRICRELPDTTSRDNTRLERLPAFISAILGIFLPEKQHRLGLLKTRQGQKQGSCTSKMQVPNHLFCSVRGMKATAEVKLLLQAVHICYKNRNIILSESVPGAGIYQHIV